MSNKSELIEFIEDAMCSIICQSNECKVCDGISCNECLKEYAQIIVDKNLNK